MRGPDPAVDKDTQLARVLYTKHPVKKKKTYHDGFIEVHSDRTSNLLDESGQRIASTKLPAQVLPLKSDTLGEEPEACTQAKAKSPL